jgi:hypothetical protein
MRIGLEVRDLLPHTVFQDDEVISRQVVDGFALSIDDANVERDDGDAGAERWSL